MISRRKFVGSFGKGLAAGAAASAFASTAKSYVQILGANDRLNFAINGLNGRGHAHLASLGANSKTARLAYICDVDSGILGKFAADAEQKLVWATAMAPAADVFATPYPGGAAWKTRPCWYVIGSDDHTVNPELERFVANRMNAKTTEIASSHVPMLSHPDVVLDVIREAASSL